MLLPSSFNIQRYYFYYLDQRMTSTCQWGKISALLKDFLVLLAILKTHIRCSIGYETHHLFLNILISFLLRLAHIVLLYLDNALYPLLTTADKERGKYWSDIRGLTKIQGGILTSSVVENKRLVLNSTYYSIYLTILFLEPQWSLSQ